MSDNRPGLISGIYNWSDLACEELIVELNDKKEVMNSLTHKYTNQQQQKNSKSLDKIGDQPKAIENLIF